MTAGGEGSVSLFAYGSLRDPKVQLATFGRLVEGRPDALPGFALVPLAITDAQVIATSGAAVHSIAVPSGDPADLVPGFVYILTEAELDSADRYEVDAYRRILVRLASDEEAFVYVGAQP